MGGEHVLQARADEKILLLEPQLPALWRRIVRIEHTRQILRLDLVLHGRSIVALVERIDPERRERAARPQPQMIDRRAAIARDQLIEGNRVNLVRIKPAMRLLRRACINGNAATAEPYRIAQFAARGFPWIPQHQPAAGRFTLRATLIDQLRKNAVVVADAVADRRVLL